MNFFKRSKRVTLFCSGRPGLSGPENEGLAKYLQCKFKYTWRKSGGILRSNKNEATQATQGGASEEEEEGWEKEGRRAGEGTQEFDVKCVTSSVTSDSTSTRPSLVERGWSLFANLIDRSKTLSGAGSSRTNYYVVLQPSAARREEEVIFKMEYSSIMADVNLYTGNGTALLDHLDMSNRRFLAASDGITLDYTVLAVVILTLALILVIEVLRHKLDEWASGSPFFKTVLELMYRELTTLGMVECVIYLLHKYWADFNLAYEVVFIDIHFMLFYTAVINAVQSSLVRVLTTRLTNKQWTMTEDIDIYHYVAIRKEFDRLEEQFQLDKSIPASVHDSISGNDLFPENRKNFRSMFNEIAFRIRHPYLSSRKKALIVPVRFHELRAHFIESNNLPQKFKVSPYLNLSLTSVLLEFVHISPAAWILLMASANILYFLSGAILDATGYTGSVTTFMVAVFFSVAALFAVLQFFITLKMKSIFSHIINTKTWTDRAAFDESSEERSREQLNLFWGGAPHYIIVATQYCQFGYAIGLAVIAVYNKELAKGDWVMTMLLVWLASYAVFLFLVNRMMPWYTLCTSMGQLVNKERLHQTLAKVKLKEELRKKEAIHEEIKAAEEMERRKKEEESKAQRLLASKVAKPVPDKSPRVGITDSIVANVGNVFKRSSAEERKRLRKGRQKSISDGVQFMRDFNAADTARSFHDTPPRLSDAAVETLVSVDEDQTFQQPPLTDLVDGQNNVNLSLDRKPPSKPTVEERRRERRRLRKSQSENVVTMRAMNNDRFFALDTSTSRQRRSIAHNIASSAQLSNHQAGGRLNDHLAPKEEFCPIKSEEEGTKTYNHVDNDVRTPFSQNGNNYLDGDKVEPDSKMILPPPTILSSSMDDFSIPSGRLSSREDESTNASEIFDRRKARRQRRNLGRTQSEGVAFMRSSLADIDSAKTTSLAPVCELGGDAQLETLAGLAKLSTKDLPEIPPYEEKKRRSRLRSASDGVATMTIGLVRDTDTPKSPAFTGDNDSVKQSSTKSLTLSAEKDLPIGSTSDVFIDKERAKPNNRVSFAIFHSSSASKEALSSPTDRMSSIDSAASDDGSDIDDVPDALPVDISSTPSKHILCAPRIDFTSFLQSAKYRAASFLYGPMICLFVIGRVEAFNIRSGVLIDQRNTYHMRLQDTFFVECSLYCLMMLEMCFVFTYFTRHACLNEGKGYATMKSVTAAGWGFLINVLCLLLLLIAESQRCCYPSSTVGQAYEDGKLYGENVRGLGEAYDATTSGESYYPVDETAKCTCKDFGYRWYGGLGNIEPFTVLIVLSPLRFLFASYTLRMIGYRSDKHGQASNVSDQNHGSHDDFDMKTKARELWLSTVGIHSDVAMKFGMFSGQFLQCMLGIYSPDQDSDDNVKEPTTDISDKDFGSSQPSAEPSIENSDEREFKTLTSLDSTSDTPKMPHQRRTAYDFESFGVVFDDFSYPSSRLIRRMRRCERRLLPFLDEWQVVDVVLTSHELVLFDVHEEIDFDTSEPKIDLATNGGKGLRLCDVARGRKILSQFDLDDIDFVDIEHRLATVSDSTNDVESGHEQLLEFWQGGNDHINGYRLQNMNLRWCNVNEDRLKVHFKSGGGTTLFVRFTVDLKEMEKRKLELQTGEELSDIGRQAKVWCRTIAHLRGANNLTKQSLPHFNDDQEMDDFIELCPREAEIQEGRLKALLRRNTSFAFDDQTLAKINGADI